MLGKKVVKEVNKKEVLSYKFNINDPVYHTSSMIKNAVVESRYRINNENFYKIKNLLKPDSVKVCKEKELIHR